MTERRGSTGRVLAWWRRVVDHFRWDDAGFGVEVDGSGVPGQTGVPPAGGLHHVSLDQLLERAAARRTQRGGAPG